MSKKPFRYLAVITFVFAVFTVEYYLWSDIFIAEFQTDITDTLLWAKAAYEAGSLLNPDFYYAYTIPLGGQLLMLPFIRSFGVSILTLRLGMTIFTAIMISVSLLFFYVVVYNRSVFPSLFSTGCLFMLLEANKKLREIMFAHVIHYSLAIIFFMSFLVVVSEYLDESRGHSKREKVLLLTALAVIAFICAADGLPVIAFAIVPVGGAVFLLCLLKSRTVKYTFRSERILFLVMVGSSALGLGLYFYLRAGMHEGYSSQYLKFSPPEVWLDNFKKTVSLWRNQLYSPALFKDMAPQVAERSFFSRVTGKGVKLFMTGTVPVLAVMSTLFFKGLKSEKQKLTVLSFWVLFAVTLILHTVTMLSSFPWRMIPALAMMFVCYAVLISSLYSSKNPWMKKAAVVLLTGFSAWAFCCGIGMVAGDVDPSFWFSENSLITLLEERGLTRGFSDEFLSCETNTLLSDNRLKIDFISTEDGKFYPELYQNMPEDFLPDEDTSQYFVVLFSDKAKNECKERDDVVDRFTGEMFVPWYEKYNDKVKSFEVMVFDHYPLESEMHERYN